MAEATLYISGPIVADASEADGVYPYTMLEDVLGQLERQKPYDGLRIIINSPGGRVDKGLGIYDYVTALPGVTITTEAIGQCSSIANAIFLAGSVRLAHRHVESLVHLPVGGVIGADAAGAQEFADDMAETQRKLIALYVERAKVDEGVITALMTAETTLTADELLAHGIATQIVQPATALAILPKHATSSAAADQAPGWATAFMSKISQSLGALATAMKGVKQPAKAQADGGTAAKALDVATVGGDTLTIATGDRDVYQVGDAVTDADGNPAADADYDLSDGNTLTVADGSITAINPTEADDTSAKASAEQQDAIVALATAVTALAGEVRSMKTAQATTAATVTRIAAGAGSKAAPARAQAAHDDAKDGDDDPAKKAGEARAERRKNRYGKP